MESIKITPVDQLYMKLNAPLDILKTIKLKFTFKVPGFQYTNEYKYGTWDGNFSLFNTNLKTFPIGCLIELIKFCKTMGYTFNVDPSLIPKKLEYDAFLDSINTFINPDITPREYQLNSLIKSIQFNRAITESSTGSGKSLIIYLLIRFFIGQLKEEEKILLSVPNGNLMLQMQSDFASYETDNYVSSKLLLLTPKNKQPLQKVTISTWALLKNQSPEFFNDVSVYVCDEVHQAQAPALQKLFHLMKNTPYRYGFTGTLENNYTNVLQCKAWFGPVIKVTSTEQLVKDGNLSHLIVKPIFIKFPPKLTSYAEEMQIIVNNIERNRIIVDLALQQPNNSIVLFQLKNHGRILLNYAEELASKFNKKILFIDGDVCTDERDKIRNQFEDANNIILFASYGTMSTGVNIKNLHNVFFAAPYKSKKRILQSIGRVLRLHESKDNAFLFDIVDDMCPLTQHKKTPIKTNAYKHWMMRLAYYKNDGFQVDQAQTFTLSRNLIS